MIAAYIGLFFLVYVIGMAFTGYICGRTGQSSDTACVMVLIWPLGLPLLLAEWAYEKAKAHK